MSPVFGAQPAQQGIGLDDRLHRRRNNLPFNGQPALQAGFQQGGQWIDEDARFALTLFTA